MAAATARGEGTLLCNLAAIASTAGGSKVNTRLASRQQNAIAGRGCAALSAG